MTSFPSILGNCTKDPLQFHLTKKPAKLRYLETARSKEEGKGYLDSQWPTHWRTSVGFNTKDLISSVYTADLTAFITEKLIKTQQTAPQMTPALSPWRKPTIRTISMDPSAYFAAEVFALRLFVFTDARCLSPCSLPSLLLLPEPKIYTHSQSEPLCACKMPVKAPVAACHCCVYTHD